MMAPAIDHGSGAARRPTDRARSARAIGTRAGGCRATGAGDSAVGRRPQLRHDRDDDGLQFADDRVVETPVRAGRPAGMGGPASRLETDGADARPGCAQHDLDPSAAAARRDPVVHAIARAETGGAAHDCRAGLAAGGPATASARTVHAVDGSGVRDEGRRRDRPVSRSPATCRGLLRRREDRDSSAGSARSRPATVAGARRTPRVRVRPAWDAVARYNPKLWIGRVKKAAYPFA